VAIAEELHAEQRLPGEGEKENSANSFEGRSQRNGTIQQ
jgi:hypothetical protein